jgi:hypothetical protein
MSNLTKKYGFISLLILLISLSLFVLMIYQVEAQSKKLSEQVKIIVEQQSRETSFQQLQRQYTETAEEREILQSLFLEREGDNVDFLTQLSQIESLAQQVGVSLVTKRLELVDDKPNKTSNLRADFSFSGTEKQTHQFISVLENLPYLLKINEIKMMTKNSNEWEVDLVVEVGIFAYET